ncbi:MAG TPA: hypothetical protein VGG72_20035 [Bryobacteraceae bacterium]|jgi:hypothetical protein
MDIDDAEEAVRKVYFEYLADHFKDDAVERQHRENRFDNSSPNSRDVTAIQKAREAYIESVGSGRALDAARDALYGQFDREEIRRKEVDPKRYSTDSDYHQRMNGLIEQGVEERRQDRQQQRQDGTLQSPSQRLQEAQEAEPDWQRYAQDKEYRAQVDEREKAQQQTQRRQATAQRDREP